MSIDRTILKIAGPTTIALGLAAAVAPEFFARLAGITTTPGGLTDLRAVYAGLQLGLGGFLWWCSRDAERTGPGLLLLCLAVGEVGAMRALGLLIDGAPSAYNLGNLALEVAITAGVAAVLVRRTHRVAAAAH